MAENIKVAVRVRPFNDREKQLGSTCVVGVEGNSTIVNGKTFTYDFSYWSHDDSQPMTTQEHIWNDVGEVILQNALNGFNGCLFAYGQTGSGKTFSVLGCPEPALVGIIPRAVQRVFQEKAEVEKDETVQICVWVSYLEIYQEHIHDLLCPKQDNVDLSVMQHPKFGVYVPNLTEDPCETAEKVQDLMEFGTKRRAVAATQMNATSSRSHSVFCIKVERLDGPRPDAGAADTRHALKAKINLVDLAGSERQSKTGAEGATLKEGCAINKSLSALGLVIKELSESHSKNSHDEHDKHGEKVAFRASKLTFLLKDSLSGNSRTYMIAAISPASDNVEETLSTLRFASSVKAIKTVAKQNKDKKDAIIDALREELEELRKNAGTGAKHTDAASIEERERLLEETQKGYAHQMEEANELAELRKSAIDHGGLSQGDMGKMLGVEEDTPYLLNMSEDTTMAGKLLFYLPANKPISIGSADDSEIRFSGVGVTPLLCKIDNEDNHSLKITKCGKDGRVVHDGSVLKDGQSRDLKHGQSLFFGRAIALKVVVPAMAKEELASHELMLDSLDEEWKAIDASPAMEKVEGFLHQVLQEMQAEASAAFVREVNRVAHLCDEANEITSTLRPGEGISFDVTLTSGKPPHIVVHASQTTEEDGYRLVYLCSGEQFAHRLEKMREAHFVFEKKNEVHVEEFNNPWEELNHDEIHQVVHELRAKVEHLGGEIPSRQTVHLKTERESPSSPNGKVCTPELDVAAPCDSVQDESESAEISSADVASAAALSFVRDMLHRQDELATAVNGGAAVQTPDAASPAGAVNSDFVINLTDGPSNGAGGLTSRQWRSVPTTPLGKALASVPTTPIVSTTPPIVSTTPSTTPSGTRYGASSRFVLATAAPVSPPFQRSLVGSPGPSRRSRGRSRERSLSIGLPTPTAIGPRALSPGASSTALALSVRTALSPGLPSASSLGTRALSPSLPSSTALGTRPRDPLQAMSTALGVNPASRSASFQVQGSSTRFRSQSRTPSAVSLQVQGSSTRFGSQSFQGASPRVQSPSPGLPYRVLNLSTPVPTTPLLVSRQVVTASTAAHVDLGVTVRAAATPGPLQRATPAHEISLFDLGFTEPAVPTDKESL